MPTKVLKIIKRSTPINNTNSNKNYVMRSDTINRQPVKLINKLNGRPKPVVQKAGYTVTKRVFRNGGKTK